MKTVPDNIEKLKIKVTKTILLFSTLLLLMIICNDLYLNFYFLAALKLPIIIIFGLAYLKMKFSGFKEFYTHFVNIPILIFFVINYLGNHGTNGPTFYGILTLFVVYPILLSNKWKWIYTIFTMLSMSVLLYSGIDRSHLFLADYANNEDQFADHLLTFLSVAIFIVSLVSLVLEFYKRQNKELEVAKNLLRSQITIVESEKRNKENLLGILAHDVRNPVYNLGQLIELYEDESLTEAELKRMMEGMKSRIVDLQATIENILNNIKRETALQKENGTFVSPLIFTQKLIETLYYKIENKKQTIRFEHPEESFFSQTFLQSSHEITIILKNLIDNAIKYSSEGSEIKVILKTSEGQILWQVEDRGRGIAKEIQNQIFQQSVTSQNGSGLGLYLCKSIADSIGASLNFIPKHQGSIFQLKVSLG